MKKMVLWGLVLVLILSGCYKPVLATPTSTPAPTIPIPITDVPEQPTPTSGPQTYPLETGAYWVYEGPVSYEVNGAVTEEILQWRVEVVEKVERLNVTGYLMRGSLYDLAFYTPGTQPREYAILQIGGDFYTADLAAYDRLKDPADSLVELVNESALFLRLPLESGDRFCETAHLAREDGAYCWVVGEIQPADQGQAYPLSYRTNSDYTQVSFEPGVGFISFTYHHNGSVSDADMHLVEYGLGANQ